MKVEFKKINKEKVGDVTIKAIEAKEQLSACQKQLVTNPLDQSLRILKKELVGKCFEALKIEEDFLRQKSRIQWLDAGDKNSSFFFKSISSRRNNSKIITIQRQDGSFAKGDKTIKDETVNFFQNLMGRKSSHDPCRASAIRNILQSTISREQAQMLSNEVTGAEIKQFASLSILVKLQVLMGSMGYSSKRHGQSLVKTLLLPLKNFLPQVSFSRN